MPDAERHLDLVGRAWLALGIGPQRDPPSLSRLEQPLAQARLALVTTGGFVPPGGEPFNTGKRGDPTFREIAADVAPAELEIYHPHYDHDIASKDINVLFPIPLGRELVAAGVVGALAETHYSFMGYVPVTRKLDTVYGPRVAGMLEQREVDAVLLTPA